MAVELVDDVEVVNPCSRTIEALDGAAARVSIEFPVEELSAHRIVHSCEVYFLTYNGGAWDLRLSIEPGL